MKKLFGKLLSLALGAVMSASVFATSASALDSSLGSSAVWEGEWEANTSEEYVYQTIQSYLHEFLYSLVCEDSGLQLDDLVCSNPIPTYNLETLEIEHYNVLVLDSDNNFLGTLLYSPDMVKYGFTFTYYLSDEALAAILSASSGAFCSGDWRSLFYSEDSGYVIAEEAGIEGIPEYIEPSVVPDTVEIKLSHLSDYSLSETYADSEDKLTKSSDAMKQVDWDGKTRLSKNTCYHVKGRVEVTSDNTLPQSSMIIVEDGGKLIIKDGARLYAKGTIIVSENANLFINGKSKAFFKSTSVCLVNGKLTVNGKAYVYGDVQVSCSGEMTVRGKITTPKNGAISNYGKATLPLKLKNKVNVVYCG